MPREGKFFVAFLGPTSHSTGSAATAIERGVLSEQNFHIEYYNQADGTEISSDALAEVDVLMISSSARLGETQFNECKNLKCVVSLDEFFDNIDVDAASKRNIRVTYVPVFGIEDLADHTIGLILSLYRKVPSSSQLLLQGESFHGPDQIIARGAPGARRIRNQVLGLVGFGPLGVAILLRARAYGFQTVMFDATARHGIEKAIPCDRVLSLEALVSRCDCLVLARRKDEKEPLITATTLSLMKKGSFIVNTSQGGLIDEAALANALKSGHIGGAALDIIDKSLSPSPLLGCPNVYVTPRVGPHSQRSADEMCRLACKEVLLVQADQSPVNCVNEDYLVRNCPQPGPSGPSGPPKTTKKSVWAAIVES